MSSKQTNIERSLLLMECLQGVPLGDQNYGVLLY